MFGREPQVSFGVNFAVCKVCMPGAGHEDIKTLQNAAS